MQTSIAVLLLEAIQNDKPAKEIQALKKTWLKRVREQPQLCSQLLSQLPELAKKISVQELPVAQCLTELTQLLGASHMPRLLNEVLSQRDDIFKLGELAIEFNQNAAANGMDNALADTAHNLARLLNHHAHYSPEPIKEFAPLMAQLAIAFPQQMISLNSLEAAADGVQLCATLLQHHFIEQQLETATSLLNDMLGEYAEADDFAHAHCIDILTMLLASQTEWPANTADRLIVEILQQLGLDLTPAEQRVEKLQAALERLRGSKDKMIKNLAAEYRSELDEIQRDYDAVLSKEKEAAAKRIKQNRVSANAIKRLIKHFPQSPCAAILIELINQPQNIKKRFPINRNEPPQFQSIGLKLLVINALMYEQEQLTPKFEPREFAKEWNQEEILTYFIHLPIPKALLETIETLYLDSGLSGGLSIYYELNPYWDPGCGDEPTPLGDEAIEDLVLLPNLTTFIGLENSQPSTALVDAFTSRGIRLELES